METQVRNFFDLPLPQLEKHLQACGKQKFRARQIFKWVYEKGILDPEEMTDLSKEFRANLGQYLDFSLPDVVEHKVSVDGTQKFLFDVGDCQTVEAVMIPHESRNTLCLSSEVGCNMACKFCFTGKQKLKKRLSVGQIVGQLVQAKHKMPDVNLTNIVFMGMGEPLDNCENVFPAIEIFKCDLGLNFSRRKITVSTSGLVDQIPLITESGTRLAVSLNAPNDEIRNSIMPINRKWNLEALLEACREHARITGDRVTFEYVLLKGVTDHMDHAKWVHELIRDIPCKLNLIPFNEHPDSGYVRPERNRVFHFQRYLLEKGMHVTIRRTMGRDIFAACGQLTSMYKGRPESQEVNTGVLG